MNYQKEYSHFSLDVIIQAKSFQGDIIAFSMTDSQYFSIEESANRPNEAKIRLTSKLNYETEDHRSHTLVITARERGSGLSSTAQVSCLPLNVANQPYKLSLVM